MTPTQQKIQRARAVASPRLDKTITPFESLADVLSYRADVAGDAPYLIALDSEGDAVETFSNAAFYDRARRTARFLADDLAIAPGDRIATLTGNRAATVLLYFGAWLAGIVVVPVNTTEDDARIGFLLQHAGVKVVFAPTEQTDRVRALAPNAPFRLLDTGFVERLADYAPLSPLPDTGHETDALIVYTSGTTGAPKGVVLTQGNLLADAHAISSWHRFTETDRALCVLPIHHVNGTVVTLVTPLCSGGSVALAPKFSVSHFFSTIERHEITWSSVVPTLLAFLLERASSPTPKTQNPTPTLRHLLCGAGPLSCSLAKRFHETFGIRVVHGYGLSETTCYSCFLPVDLSESEFARFLWDGFGFPSIGTPLPGNAMAIHDDSGRELGPGERGEIVIRGPIVTPGYFLRPDADADAFAHDWFRSGDEGFYVPGDDGAPYFFITGRLKELIIRGGVNYAPLEIDEALAGIDGVRAAISVGFEHETHGEEIGAYVVLQPGATVTADDILEHCARRLPFAKRPKVVVFGDEFPVTSTGKYQRNRLKDRFSAFKHTEFRP